jgi:hypothetical protein
MKLTYLASPFSHESWTIRWQRFYAVCEVAASLLRQGVLVYSPIAHTYEMAEDHDLPTDWQFWERHCRAFLMASEQLIVLKLDGWEQSVGVAAEIKIAEEIGIPVSYMEHVR